MIITVILYYNNVNHIVLAIFGKAPIIVHNAMNVIKTFQINIKHHQCIIIINNLRNIKNALSNYSNNCSQLNFNYLLNSYCFNHGRMCTENKEFECRNDECKFYYFIIVRTQLIYQM